MKDVHECIWFIENLQHVPACRNADHVEVGLRARGGRICTKLFKIDKRFEEAP